ncbi:LemA family protein [Prosthecochloris sp. N3]|uniref:LemA family protein n=1 Tax=Prosthecochloris ethylica TaxID=2743976 RepID=A0ABR9XV11_9CHLB|nr:MULTISPECIES: LemA family protein [Prosthecochloris]MEC9487318.1 LemA family protein [Prosthecochloris sp.]MBF0585650.1 LemA family protein [Prosthecochloris ethylica]MBF0637703.1 LemA family protein [Prosthecochloris ethylica]NUK46859.1 LemA family protein [Prosthecochloris ethylica]RNA67382.1 LemA family protein [Prosthecochloris sp. ZM_2]
MIMFVVLAASHLQGCGYNAIQQKDEAVSKAWGDLEAQLQRRSDLVPNLVATVRGAADFEQETLTGVVEARAKASSVQLTPDMLSDPQAMQQFQAAQGELSSMLSRLMVVVERYPQIQANQNFRDLQNQLEGTENRISVARQRYNAAVEDFNYSIRMFPNSITNNLLLNLEQKEYFRADASAREVPEVSF